MAIHTRIIDMLGVISVKQILVEVTERLASLSR